VSNAAAASQVPSWTIWVPVVAALGASLLTGLATWGIGQWQQAKRDKGEAQQARSAAYRELLIYSVDFIRRAQALGHMVRLRSGFAEGVAVTLRQRKPVEMFDLFEWVDKSMQPLTAAWSQIWLVGSQAAIDAADSLMNSCADFMEAATASDPGRGYLAKLVKGEAPSAEQTAAFHAALKCVSRERVAFARLVRKDLGRIPVTFTLEREPLRDEP
jgi:hypothetical protein